MNVKNDFKNIEKFFDKHEQNYLRIFCNDKYDDSIYVSFIFHQEANNNKQIVENIIEDFKKNFDFEINLFEGYGWVGDGKSNTGER